MAVELRKATLADLELLLRWRNDSLTRRESKNTAVISLEEHRKWLQASLINPDRKLFVAEEKGIPVGTVRADFDGEAWELSWTVAPEARGRGLGKRMVVCLASQIGEPVRAEVRVGNTASAKIALDCGMAQVKEEKGILHFFRPGKK